MPNFIVKKRPAIGITITVLVLSVVVGIATLPDEVLLEPSTENSQAIQEDIPFVPKADEVSNLVAQAEEKKNAEKTKAELDALKMELEKLKKEISQTQPAAEIPQEVAQVPETPQEEFDSETEGKIISINISDGVGGGDH